jgi:hypothetical protein
MRGEPRVPISPPVSKAAVFRSWWQLDVSSSRTCAGRGPDGVGGSEPANFLQADFSGVLRMCQGDLAVMTLNNIYSLSQRQRRSDKCTAERI